MTPFLEARGLRIDRRLDVSELAAERGQLIAVIGPNGGGKTSLLRALAGVEDASGAVRIEGDEVRSSLPARRARLLSFLPASRDIAWPISARDVMRLGLPSPRPAREKELIDQLELAGLIDRPVNRLSTGERARVLLGRALAARPKLLLLDEPLSNLDPYWAIRIVEILRAEVSSGDSSAFVSLHDIDRTDAFDRALLIDRGAIVADDKPEAVLAGEHLANAFGIERSGARWAISRRADRRSSP